MSSSIVLLIVAIVLIVIIAYLIGVIIRKKNDGRIDALAARKDTLLNLPIAQEVETVKQLALVGQSQHNFEEWEDKWQEISEGRLKAIESQLEDVQSYNDTFNFVKTKSELNRLDQELAGIKDELTAIADGLDTLKAQEEKNSARVKYALDLYEDLQTSIVSQEKAFGTALPEIDKQLHNIQAEFSQFVALNSSGDPVEAAEILERAEEHTIALGQISEKVPDLYKALSETLPDQLIDLEDGYAKLLEEGYHFGDQSIESRFQIVREAISEAKEELADLELDKVEGLNKDAQERVDALYDLFEKEIAAHKKVRKSIRLIPKYMAHAQSNNDQLTKELARLSRQYILEDTESQIIKSLTRELEKIETDILPGLLEEELPEQPFTVLESVYSNAVGNLKRIESEQLEAAERLEAIEQSEGKSRQLLDNYVNRLHIIKRFMEKRNLPGIPQDFLSLFFTTSSQLEALMAELSRGRIDIQTVNKLTETATAGMASLETTAYEVIQYATLTEQLLQYSNRYRSFEQNVQNSFDTALHLFEVNQDYRAAFDEISYALEIVEPGVTDRFVKSYEKTKETIRF